MECSRNRHGWTGVAILDTGIAGDHPEISGKVTRSVQFHGRERRISDLDHSHDTEGHGTHVAGLLCGTRVGVAPSVRVVNGIIIPNGSGTLSNFVLGLDWAARQEDIQIVNLSAGIPGFVDSEPLMGRVFDMLTLGVLSVFAIGNEGRNQTRSPGNYSPPVSVGASTKEQKVAGFSSSGTMVVDHQQYVVPDLVAPGKNVYSSVMGGGYEAWNGTSMASPIVAGIAALSPETNPDFTIHDLIDFLVGICEKIDAPDDRQGKGLINVSSYGAFAKARAKSEQ